MTDEPFFKAPPPPPEPEEDDEEYEPQPWHGPASNVLGGFSPVDLTLARTADVVVFVRGILAYENGFEFEVEMRCRNWEVSESMGDAFHGYPPFRRRPGDVAGEIPPERFRFGIQYPDGSKATNLDSGFGGGYGDEPEPPVLWERGGSGGGTQWQQRYWVWPLPPAEPFAFVCEWPAAEIPLTHVEVDGAQIVDASRRAEELWPREPRSRRFRTSMGSWFGMGAARVEDDEEEEA